MTSLPRLNGYGCHVIVVDAGTVIKDERTGREETVTENSAVTKGALIYCTQRIFDALKERCPTPPTGDRTND